MRNITYNDCRDGFTAVSRLKAVTNKKATLTADNNHAANACSLVQNILAQEHTEVG
jgi:hypothetical protein